MNDSMRVQTDEDDIHEIMIDTKLPRPSPPCFMSHLEI